MNIGVFACDPGKATGLAWGIFSPHHKEGVAGSLRDRMNSGSTTAEGEIAVQIREIAQTFSSFYNACVKAFLPTERVWYVCEDYIQVPGMTAGGRDTQISSSIIWGVEGYRMGRADEFKRHRRGGAIVAPLILQVAGQASTYATNDRLKEWGVWVPGRDHERSAWRHIALFLSRYKQHFPEG